MTGAKVQQQPLPTTRGDSSVNHSRVSVRMAVNAALLVTAVVLGWIALNRGPPTSADLSPGSEFPGLMRVGPLQRDGNSDPLPGRSGWAGEALGRGNVGGSPIVGGPMNRRRSSSAAAIAAFLASIDRSGAMTARHEPEGMRMTFHVLDRS